MAKIPSIRAEKNNVLRDLTRASLAELFVGVPQEKQVEIENDIQLLVRFALKQIADLTKRVIILEKK